MQIKRSGFEHMKFLTFGTSLNKLKHPRLQQLYQNANMTSEQLPSLAGLSDD